MVIFVARGAEKECSVPRPVAASGTGDWVQGVRNHTMSFCVEDAVPLVVRRGVIDPRPVQVRQIPVASATLGVASGALRLSSPYGLLAHSGAPRGAAQTDPGTGVEFPGEFCPRGRDAKCHTLAGVATRVKKIGPVGVKVYAVGLYVDEDGLASVEGSGSAHNDSHEVPQAFVEGYTGDGQLGKSLRLVITYGKLTPDKLSSSLREALEPRMRGAEGEASLARFGTAFVGANLSKGTVITFSHNPESGALVTAIDGRVAGEVNDANLTRELFGLYTRDDGVLGRKAAKQLSVGVAHLVPSV